jgi:hypothetical protein
LINLGLLNEGVILANQRSEAHILEMRDQQRPFATSSARHPAAPEEVEYVPFSHRSLIIASRKKGTPARDILLGLLAGILILAAAWFFIGR